MRSKHRYSSAVADGGNSSLVQPSNWNDEHVPIMPVAGKAANYMVVAGDQGTILRAAHSAALGSTLPAASACDSDWAVWIENRLTGTGAAAALSISHAGADTIDGVAAAARRSTPIPAISGSSTRVVRVPSRAC